MDASHGAHGVSALNTPKPEDHCLFVFGKGFEVDIQTLVVNTRSSSHHKCAFTFVLFAHFTQHLSIGTIIPPPTSFSQLTITIPATITAKHSAMVHPSPNVKASNQILSCHCHACVFDCFHCVAIPLLTTRHMQEKFQFLKTTLILYLPTYLFEQVP